MKIHKQNRERVMREEELNVFISWLRFSRLLGKTFAMRIGFVPNDMLSGLEITLDLKIGHKEEYVSIS